MNLFFSNNAMDMRDNFRWVSYIQLALLFLILIAAIAFPWVTVQTVLVAFALLVIIQGIFAMVGGITFLSRGTSYWLNIFYGLASLIIGFGILAVPALSLLTLGYILAGWLLASGTVDLIDAFRLKKGVNRALTAVSGLVLLVLAVIVFLFPATSAIGFMWFVGIYLVLWIIVAWSQLGVLGGSVS